MQTLSSWWQKSVGNYNDRQYDQTIALGFFCLLCTVTVAKGAVETCCKSTKDCRQTYYVDDKPSTVFVEASKGACFQLDGNYGLEGYAATLELFNGSKVTVAKGSELSQLMRSVVKLSDMSSITLKAGSHLDINGGTFFVMGLAPGSLHLSERSRFRLGAYSEVGLGYAAVNIGENASFYAVHDYKLLKARLDLEFLTKCEENGLIPRFLEFRLANTRRRNSSSYRSAQEKFLQDEISEKRGAVRRLEAELSHLQGNFRQRVSYLDYSHITTKIGLSNNKRIQQQQIKQQAKFERLRRDQTRAHHDPKMVIHNYSSHQLTPLQEKVLSRGLNFALPPKKLEEQDYFVPFELLYRSASKLPVWNSDHNFLRTRLKDIAVSSLHSYNTSPAKPNLTKAELAAVKELASVPDLVIHKSDKGNSVVLLDRQDYVSKMMVILNDRQKFHEMHLQPGKELNFHKSKEQDLRKTLSSLKAKGAITQETYDKLAPTGSQPGKMYGLSKVHKEGAPLRPILSAIGTASYSLAKALVPVLSPVATNEFCIKDSFAFAKEICGHDSTGLCMASFDVKSLFTNIPLDETIELVVQGVFELESAPMNCSRDEFRKLLESCVKDACFVFDSKYYKQVDGVAMGSPLGPVLANAFLCHYEKLWLRDCPVEFRPVLYRRYIDDTFLLFKDPSHVPLFLNYLNQQHPNIEFTCEAEENGVLPFLDINVNRTDSGFTTSVYRKETFSGVYSHFDSFAPSCYKYGLIRTLLYRSYMISDTLLKFHDEIVVLKGILTKNGFPMAVIDRCVSMFLDKLYKTDIPVVTCAKRPPLIIVLPFTGLCSLRARERIVSLFKQCLPQVECKVVFQCSFRLSRYFPFKDRVACFQHESKQSTKYAENPK